jgi:hypothetical protein
VTPYILVEAYEVSEETTSSIIRIVCTDDGYCRFSRNSVHSCQITQNPEDGIIFIRGNGKLQRELPHYTMNKIS